MNHYRSKPGTSSHRMPHITLGYGNMSTPKEPTNSRDAGVSRYRVVFILP